MTKYEDPSSVTIVEEGEGSDARLMVSFKCPWCETRSTDAARQVSTHPLNRERNIAVLVRCQSPGRCGFPALVIADRHQPYQFAATAWVARSLHPTPRAEYAEEGVPDNVARDFREALECLAAGHHFGAALVGRRVLQVLARERGGKGGNLAEEIASLEDDVLPPLLKKAATQIRLIGNRAAHAEDVDQPAVKALLSFLSAVLHHVYVLPAQIAKATGSAPP
jgi:hypothetical protein